MLEADRDDNVFPRHSERPPWRAYITTARIVVVAPAPRHRPPHAGHTHAYQASPFSRYIHLHFH